MQNTKERDQCEETVIFNTATSKDFTPRITNSGGTIYENVELFKWNLSDFSTPSFFELDIGANPDSGIFELDFCLKAHNI